MRHIITLYTVLYTKTDRDLNLEEIKIKLIRAKKEYYEDIINLNKRDLFHSNVENIERNN